MVARSEPTDVTRFVNRLRRSREMAGFSKKELAARAGVSRQSITNWEGVRPPENGIDAKDLHGLALALMGTAGEYLEIEMLADLGYHVRAAGVENEQQAALLRLFQAIPHPYQIATIQGLQALVRELGLEVA